jgi:hypothetical protein
MLPIKALQPLISAVCWHHPTIAQKIMTIKMYCSLGRFWVGCRPCHAMCAQQASCRHDAKICQFPCLLSDAVHLAYF